MSGNGDHSELIALLELLCEDRISPAQLDRLETLVRTDHGAMSVYLEYIDLHGTLHWDTARSGSGDMDASCKTGIARRPDGAGEPVRPAATAARSAKRVARRSRWLLPALAVACLTIAFSIIAINRGPNIDSVDPRAPLIARQNEPDGGTLSGDPGRTVPKSHYAPVELNPIVPRDGQAAADLEDLPPPAARAAHSVAAVPAELSIDAVVAVINERVRARWQENEIEPSPWADDLEWLRRVSLDIVGHIPSVEATRQFQADTTASERPSAETGSDAAKDVPEVDEAVAFRSSVAVPDKRRQMVETLLDDVDYVRNWSTIWTNQLIGRGESRDVNRVALEKHLRDVFARNVSWDRIVRDFVAAEGTPAENGASAFLLAHLNNQAVPATAITARTFLCVQVQCTQCHNHPFNDWKQDQFWSLNSFFKQTRRQRVVRPDGTGRNDSPEFELVSLHVGGPTYYAKRNQEMAAAYPVFDGVSIRPDATVDRRTALAKLLTDGRRPQIADAMVNRVWAHFFGYGLTNPIDDMGPHNPPIDGELLDFLSRSFVRSGFDVKRLIRWICVSDAYQLSSVAGSGNLFDDPETGERPLFSRAYARAMSAEQIYDSLLIATRANQTPGFDWDTADQTRHDWVQQFVFAHNTEENDETSTFDGTITQALMMMNGDLIERALSGERGSLMHDVITGRGSWRDRIATLSLAAVGRPPSAAELRAFRRHLRQSSNSGREPAVVQGLQDIFWAYLNSSEFALVH